MSHQQYATHATHSTTIGASAFTGQSMAAGPGGGPEANVRRRLGFGQPAVAPEGVTPTAVALIA
jgi:hypothetical protein